MKFPIFSFAVLLVLLETTQGYSEDEETENLEQFSYQVSLRNAADNSHFCSGSILSKHHILTAAHCVYHPHSAQKTNPKQIKIVAAQLNLHIHDGSIVKNVAKVIVHPKYKNGTLKNDIAILILEDSLDLNSPYISTVKVRSIEKLANCFVSGWGATNYQAQLETFTYAKVEIMSKPECQESYAKQNVTIPNSVICAETKEEICRGDSGGPLLCRGVLTGVTSVCGNSGMPGVYTNLGHLRKWINKITKSRNH